MPPFKDMSWRLAPGRELLRTCCPAPKRPGRFDHQPHAEIDRPEDPPGGLSRSPHVPGQSRPDLRQDPGSGRHHAGGQRCHAEHRSPRRWSIAKPKNVLSEMLSLHRPSMPLRSRCLRSTRPGCSGSRCRERAPAPRDRRGLPESLTKLGKESGTETPYVRDRRSMHAPLCCCQRIEPEQFPTHYFLRA